MEDTAQALKRRLATVRDDIDDRDLDERDSLLTAFLQRCWPTMRTQDS